jgi:peptidoglycan/LPS O-acetylase OafA/YrhL
MDDSYRTDALKGHLPSLDGWRAIAILLVLIEHASLSLNPLLKAVGLHPLNAPIKDLGQLGVQIFFGLSGFLITTKLINELVTHGKIDLKAFYIRRTFRILPPAIAYLIAIFALSLAGQFFVPLSRILAALFFLANYTGARLSWYVGHFWSLAVEEHYYLIWPVAFSLIWKPKLAFKVLLSTGLLIALWRAIDYKMQLTGSSPAVFWGRTDIQADTIVYGSMAAIIVAAYGKVASTKFFDRRWLFAGAILMVMAANLPHMNWKIWMVLLSVRNIGIAAMISISVLGGMRGGYAFLQTAPLRYIGSISYSLYLWQQLFLVEREPSTGWLSYFQVFPVNILLAFACAMASKRFIEEPSIASGKRFLKRASTGRPLVDRPV